MDKPGISRTGDRHRLDIARLARFSGSDYRDSNIATGAVATAEQRLPRDLLFMEP